MRYTSGVELGRLLCPVWRLKVEIHLHYRQRPLVFVKGRSSLSSQLWALCYVVGIVCLQPSSGDDVKHRGFSLQGAGM